MNRDLVRFALATGQPWSEVQRMDDRTYATFLDVLEGGDGDDDG